MLRGRAVGSLVLAIASAACVGEPSTTTPAEAPASVRPKPRDSRLRGDCGGWEPSLELLDEASKLGDAAAKPAALAALDSASPAHRVDVLRAGLRLLDDVAAKACAARLTWSQIDRWECARCVDLLIDDVMRPGTEADFEEFRSYLGSVELTRFLRALPPTPWSVDPEKAIAETHRIARAGDIPAYIELTRSPETAVADEAWNELSLLGRWNDDFRDEVARRESELPGRPALDVHEAAGPGLPPALAAYLRWEYLEPGPQVASDDSYLVWNEKIRWCWEATPGPRDAELLVALADRGVADWTRVAGVAYALLGKLHDPKTEAFLRAKAVDGEKLAAWALARRGDAAMLDRVVADAPDDFDFALALLMEIDPTRARRLLEEVLLGPDEYAANWALDHFAEFAAPGAFFEPTGYDWRRTSFAGFDRAAIGAKIPGLRLAWIGAVVPGCRTRELAVAAARTLEPGDLLQDEERWIWKSKFKPIAAFLETAAPSEFAEALRRIRRADGDDASLAAEWLIDLGDPDSAAAAIAGPEPPFGFDYPRLARSGAPEVRRVVEDRVRELIESGGNDRNGAVAALAILNGLPESAADAVWFDDRPCPRAAAETVLEGHPVEGVAAVLAEFPDEEHGDVGAVADPRVRAYLVRLLGRRDLGHYWYATGQLAAMGDPAARAEFWGAMQDGRYRIIDHANFFTRTLGWDLGATMPFWIDELRSQCCRIVTGGGDIVERVLGLENGCFSSPWRTAHRRAKELWESAGGRFVKSRIAGHWVPAPR
jgi:hypothetical protein